MGGSWQSLVQDSCLGGLFYTRPSTSSLSNVDLIDQHVLFRSHWTPRQDVYGRIGLRSTSTLDASSASTTVAPWYQSLPEQEKPLGVARSQVRGVRYVVKRDGGYMRSWEVYVWRGSCRSGCVVGRVAIAGIRICVGDVSVEARYAGMSTTTSYTIWVGCRRDRQLHGFTVHRIHGSRRYRLLFKDYSLPRTLSP